MELCAASLDHVFLPDGDFMKYIGPMPSDVDAMLQIAQGLHYIHRQKLVHRDIKPANMLISITTPPVMKISDFGLCRQLSSQGSLPLSVPKGNTLWMAPEILKLTNSFTQATISPRDCCSIEGDIFASGCVFFYLLTKGLHPFGTLYKVTPNILDGKPTHFDGGIFIIIRFLNIGKIKMYFVLCKYRATIRAFRIGHDSKNDSLRAKRENFFGNRHRGP